MQAIENPLAKPDRPINTEIRIGYENEQLEYIQTINRLLFCIICIAGVGHINGLLRRCRLKPKKKRNFLNTLLCFALLSISSIFIHESF